MSAKISEITTICERAIALRRRCNVGFASFVSTSSIIKVLYEKNFHSPKNAGHKFKWHFREDDWQLADVTAEIYDGRPYSDVHLHSDYWLDTVKRFGPWSSYIKREVVK